jgi:glycosyltransferase involved in cell wall biosynthesis
MIEVNIVVILGAADNTHIVKWVNGLSKIGIKVYLISQHKKSIEISKEVLFYSLPIKGNLGYFFNIFALRRILKIIKPQVLNTHYASGYGLLSMLSKFKPTLLSVWGSDIFEFPKRGIIQKTLIKIILHNATQIASTSYCMRDEIRKYNKIRRIHITPFGIDQKLFKPIQKKQKDYLLIGTIKTLESNYGIDVLIESFHSLKKNIDQSINLKLQIIGGGSQLLFLKKKALFLGLNNDVEFTGRIKHSDVPLYLNNFDIYVALSKHESFGVSVLEASSVGLPVVVSDVPGFNEVVIEGKTGYIVNQKNHTYASNAIAKLVNDASLRFDMGENGIKFVEQNFTWEKSLEAMLFAYNSVFKYYKS